ncbi:uncharacterized protein [Nicotiana sylvestris]|uniref:uncharacterized protein n=1 Tax=Nicotiana sylvestris TaxID=4096 RepID=UPI00388C4600
MVRRNGKMLKRDSSNKPKNYDLCYKCGKPGHFTKDCPLLKQEFSKNYHEKIANKPCSFQGLQEKKIRFEGEEIEYDSTFALTAQSDDDEDDGNKEDRDSLTLELGEFEQTIDDLVVVVTDHKRTIEIFRKEKDDLLAKITDLRETIVKPWTKSKSENSGKGKEIASEEHIRLENEVKAMRTRICVEIEKNEQLYTNLERVKNDREKSLKWTWSSEATTAMHTNDCENRQGIGFQREKTPHNPHSKYVTVSDNWSCTQCGNTRHFKEDLQVRNQSVQKNKLFAEKVTTKEELGSTHKKRTLTAWTKRTLIHPFAYYKGPKLAWVPKTNSVVDAVQGTPLAHERRTEENQPSIPSSS